VKTRNEIDNKIENENGNKNEICFVIRGQYRKNAAAAAAATEDATVTAVHHVFGGVSLFGGLIRVVWLDG
jgi:hypothetical protein